MIFWRRTCRGRVVPSIPKDVPCSHRSYPWCLLKKRVLEKRAVDAVHVVKVEFYLLWWMLGPSSIVDSRLKVVKLAVLFLSNLNSDMCLGNDLLRRQVLQLKRQCGSRRRGPGRTTHVCHFGSLLNDCIGHNLPFCRDTDHLVRSTDQNAIPDFV